MLKNSNPMFILVFVTLFVSAKSQGIMPSTGTNLIQKVAAPLATVGEAAPAAAAPSPGPNVTSTCSITGGSISCLTANITYSGCSVTCTGSAAICQTASCYSNSSGGTCYNPPQCKCN